ncbi:MAG: PKD domain-containing protein [Bacteroidota bacterium]|nr:PKD domain-containing protein [Bacteroidota bacterium]
MFMKIRYIGIAFLLLVFSCTKILKNDPPKRPPTQPPVAAFSYYTESEGEAPARVHFYNSSKDADSCFWDFGDTSFSREFSPIHEFKSPGNFKVRLIAKNWLGSDTVEDYILITKGIVANFSFTGDGAHVPAKIRFTNLSQNANSYDWDFGDGTWDNYADPVHTYYQSGNYQVTLKAMHYIRQTKTISKTVHILPEFTSATLTQMQLTSWPFNRLNGSSWDSEPGQSSPDIYLLIEDSAGTQLYKTATVNNLMLPSTYTTSFVLNKNMWNKRIIIKMMDEDGANAEVMASSWIRISDYGPGTYPEQIVINSQYIGLKLNFSWKE